MAGIAPIDAAGGGDRPMSAAIAAGAVVRGDELGAVGTVIAQIAVWSPRVAAHVLGTHRDRAGELGPAGEESAP